MQPSEAKTKRGPVRRPPWRAEISPIDRSVETPCFVVGGWPLFDDEIGEAASAVGCRPSAMRLSPATPLSVWRRFGGPTPRILRSLDVRLVLGLAQSEGLSFVDYIDPAAWVARDGKDPFIYGSKHFMDTSYATRKGGVRTARFIAEDMSNAEQMEERFVAQCIQDFCTDGTRERLASVHEYRRLAIADNGPRDAQLPDSECVDGFKCDLCDDDFEPDSNRRAPTTWRKLLHRAEQFLREWELVRVDCADGWSQPTIRYHELDGWPLLGCR